MKQVDSRKKLLNPAEKTRSHKDAKNYVVLIDESGDLGKSPMSDPYLVLAASVTDKPEEYVRIAGSQPQNSSKYNKAGSELKFNRSSRKVRMEILDEISKLDPDIYAAAVLKSSPRWGEKGKMYRKALSEFAEFILEDSDDKQYYFLLDEHTAISPEKDPDLGCRICRRAASKKKKTIGCQIVSSKDTKSLQTHDFVVGAIGSAYNKNDDRYVKKLKKIKYKEGEAYAAKPNK